MNAVEIRDLTVEFPSRKGSIRAVDQLCLSVEDGQVFGFLGPNGAGKTTTMHVLLGFVAPTSGVATVLGQDVCQSIARQRIGYLSEHPDSYPFLTGREALMAAGRMFRIPRRTLRSRIGALLEQVDMAEAADRKIATYSRGMMQRIGVAQALVNDPDLVILDEPTGGLDPIGRMVIREIIGDLRARGKTVVFSSHELSEVELVCDHIAIMADGRVVTQGKAGELVPAGENLEKYFMTTVGADGKQAEVDG